MASEAKRGCGFRKIGGMYLVGAYIGVPCDRLPYSLGVCPVCSGGVKVGRGMTKINPLKLFGQHTDTIDVTVEVVDADNTLQTQSTTKRCGCHHPCFMCDPTKYWAYLMSVGERYYPTPEDFINEGVTQGFSKRIAQIPKDFELGQTVIYLAHPKACKVEEPVAVQQDMNILNATQPTLIDAEKVTKAMGIFTAFIPQKIEKLYWQSELDAMSEKEKEQLSKRGITPIGIPDGDSDHA